MTVLQTLITRGEAADTFGAPGHVEAKETQTATLFFLGDHVYKLKKPVHLGPVDLTSRAARLAACEAEVRLNRRLASDVYLGVADIRDDRGRLCDHMVVMRRLPAQSRLSALIRQGEPVDEQLQALAHQLTGFHERCATGREISQAGSREHLEALWMTAIARVVPYRGLLGEPEILDEIGRLALGYLAAHGPLLTDRMRTGWIREGHGDLDADKVYLLPDGPRVLACVEYDQRMRVGDVLGDVALLAVDLERLGAAAAATRFLAWYREFSDGTYPPSLQDVYVAHHALRQAAAAGDRHGHGDPDAAGEARLLADAALAHLRRAQVSESAA
ncbi:hypothetical protein I6A60_16450 [Frankia sp. AgB1.9]|uniref:hypothetical protein n=1 Tax=unclassified Frankia TaxID=2632575 RepID=UPI001932C270|nr:MULTISPECIES: hypothetical protein [unclassified Frankia]MBL7488018.1 hypothetical protein [Frankia sp. AgW1.1]MBL7549456.1 hypothetical protein [Frankia sp. AgB1.9]MBL7619928.1 hypothetical protein [Frankia sp. AgB1.8]